MARKHKTGKLFRDAGTGRFVTEEYARKHRKTTVMETVEISRKRRKK